MIVPIVSKKSLSMIEKVTRTAVTTPSRATRPKSRRPTVERSGGSTIAAGIRAAPGVENPCQEARAPFRTIASRSEEHTSELQSQSNLVCRLLLEKKKKRRHNIN